MCSVSPGELFSIVNASDVQPHMLARRSPATLVWAQIHHLVIINPFIIIIIISFSYDCYDKIYDLDDAQFKMKWVI